MQNSLLDHIDAIQESTIEADLDVLNAMSNSYLKYGIMLEHSDGCTTLDADNIIIQESVGGTIRNGLTKLWNAIKSIFKFIGSLFKRIITMVMKLFKKKTKSASQIAEECDIKPNSSVKPGSTVKKSMKTIKPQSGRSGKSSSNEISIEAIVQKMSLKINSDKGTFSIKPSEFGIYGSATIVNKKYSGFKSQYEPQKYTKIPDITYTWAWFYILMKKPHFIDDLNILIKAIISEITSNNNDITRLKKLSDEFQKKSFPEDYSENLNENDEFKYSELKRVQEQLNMISAEFDKAQFSETDMSDEKVKQSSFILNYMYSTLMDYQMSVNAVANGFYRIYMIDGSYVNQVKDYEKLALFVEKSIESGVPPRYIIENTCAIADPKLTGTTIEVKAGQTRAVLFPDGLNYVYKVAINGVGLTANKNEYVVTRKMNDEGKRLIAETDELIRSGIIAKQQKCAVGKTPTIGDMNSVTGDLMDYVKTHPEFPYNIIDLHDVNIGYDESKDRWVALDYGYICRRVI